LRALLQAGIDSGTAVEVDEAFWREREAALATRRQAVAKLRKSGMVRA
jgi:hypothetical protein